MRSKSLEASAARLWCTTNLCPRSAPICWEILAATEEAMNQFQVYFHNPPPQIRLY